MSVANKKHQDILRPSLWGRGKGEGLACWCVEEQRRFASFINALVYFITKQWFARLVKNVYYQSYQQHVHYASVALCAFGISVRLSAFTSVLSPSLCAFYMQ